MYVRYSRLTESKETSRDDSINSSVHNSILHISTHNWTSKAIQEKWSTHIMLDWQMKVLMTKLHLLKWLAPTIFKAMPISHLQEVTIYSNLAWGAETRCLCHRYVHCLPEGIVAIASFDDYNFKGWMVVLHASCRQYMILITKPTHCLWSMDHGRFMTMPIIKGPVLKFHLSITTLLFKAW